MNQFSALDEGFNWEEHYDFINIQPTRCRDQVLSNLDSEERQYINYTMPDDQKIVSSLTDECEKDSVNFVSPLRTRLNQINLQVPITGLRWDEDDRHSIIIPYPKMCRSFPDVVENLHINRRRNEKNNRTTHTSPSRVDTKIPILCGTILSSLSLTKN